ncbi:Virulence protein [Roseovarius litorisediminis]|uniref:Virulence protein n=1 Tax=Roseovarius litorisediminis TaxID=1312363 RepID=A0A1Y5SQE1_9RHOB|nr:VOC family protein [Roseovarius litorisediminis]SLN45782.1 Virulence protein [Roseovarius litorisediminis]
MPPAVSTLDHLVLTVGDLDVTIAFYRDVLGMAPEQFTPAKGAPRWALKFGSQKINLHRAGAEFEPKAARPVPGSADLCFLSETPIEEWQKHFETIRIPIEHGPVTRTGSTGPILSIYLRDPDQNLLEISNMIAD